MSETKTLMDGLKKAFADHQEISATQYNELKENGQQFGEGMKKLQDVIADISVKHEAFEKAVARTTQQSEQKSADEFELKAYNDMLHSHHIDAVGADQLSEMKSAFDRYMKVGRDRLTAEEAKSINTIIDPDGGFFVIPQYSQNITQKGFDKRGFLSAVDIISSTSGQYKEIIDWADYDLAYYKNELTTAGAPVDGEAFKEVTWNASEQIYSKKFSRNSLEDSSRDIESYVVGKLREGSMRQSGDLAVTGTGVDKPRGILTYSAGSTYGTIEQIQSGTTAKLTWSDVITLLPSALKDPYHDNSSYCMKRASFYALLSDVDGNARFQIGNQINFFSGERMSLSILGAPVVFDPNFATIATNGLAVAFGDFKETYVFCERLGFSVLRDETNPSYVLVHLRRRNDGKVRNFESTKILKIK